MKTSATRDERYKDYNLFISSCKIKNVPTGCAEKHHIKPRSHGGLNDKSNMINLSAQDHYKAHYHLAKCSYGNKMKNAFTRMSGDNPFYDGCGMTLDEAADLFCKKRIWAKEKSKKTAARNIKIKVEKLKVVPALPTDDTEYDDVEEYDDVRMRTTNIVATFVLFAGLAAIYNFILG